jgi:glycosyltransferase involved in cell wall biosynthesis
MVSSIEPRKNHLALLAAWESLRVQVFAGLKLVIVGGSAGWHNEPIMRKLAPWIQQGEVLLLRNVAAQDLRRLYKHARATVCPSFGEGFDFSGVEAMKSGGAVVASDIPVHREVCADAAEYFNPYSDADLGCAIHGVIGVRQWCAT